MTRDERIEALARALYDARYARVNGGLLERLRLTGWNNEGKTFRKWALIEAACFIDAIDLAISDAQSSRDA